ncbi:MAG: electron transfer flavoprotein subunit alpha/FixB family protein, partial [Thermoguttaceae bacterium]|nr:electron transfer flavoprotein subunit alpha/FixB family protein [Thermoguttaceae bacterium]
NDAVAADAATVAGVGKVVSVTSAAFENLLPETLANQILAVCGGYTHLLMGATSLGKATMPRVAAKLGCSMVSEATKVISPESFERAVYAGNAIATVETTEDVKVMTVRPAAFSPAEKTGSAAIETAAAVEAFAKTKFVSKVSEKSARPELSSAKMVVAGGAGVGSKENFVLIERLADKLGAAIGASRAAVDAGFVGNDLQIGQTGKIIAPDLYICAGISGAVQHVAGIKDAKTVVAINQDIDAPIFLSADYGIVGDLNELLVQLIDAI